MSSKEGEEASLKDWILEEMVSGREEDKGMITKILHKHRDVFKQLATIKENGRVTIQNYDATAKNQILAYMTGAAYAQIAELREDDAVANQELIDELGLPEGTVRPTLKTLREKKLVVQKQQGLHRINYRKLNEIIPELKSSKE